MVQIEPKSVRIKFQKVGRLCYISHLDLCRTMSTALVRAGIPFWYTEGFNPHPKMVFSQPVPLFCESTCELLDIKIVKDMPCEEILTRLKSALPDDLAVLEVYLPERKLNDITHAKYEIFTDTGSTFDAVLSDSIIVTKKSKGGEKSVDIRPQIRSLSCDSGKITAVLDASNASYLNPELFCSAMKLTDYTVRRVQWLCNDEEFK